MITCDADWSMKILTHFRSRWDHFSTITRFSAVLIVHTRSYCVNVKVYEQKNEMPFLSLSLGCVVEQNQPNKEVVEK